MDLILFDKDKESYAGIPAITEEEESDSDTRGELQMPREKTEPLKS
jgi:hypothetical protein